MFPYLYAVKIITDLDVRIVNQGRNENSYEMGTAVAHLRLPHIKYNYSFIPLSSLPNRNRVLPKRQVSLKPSYKMEPSTHED